MAAVEASPVGSWLSPLSSPYLSPRFFYHSVRCLVAARDWVGLAALVDSLPSETGPDIASTDDSLMPNNSITSHPGGHALWHTAQGHVLPGLVSALENYYHQRYAILAQLPPDVRLPPTFVFAGRHLLRTVYHRVRAATTMERERGQLSGAAEHVETVLRFDQAVGQLSVLPTPNVRAYVALRNNVDPEIFTRDGAAADSAELKVVFLRQDSRVQVTTAYVVVPDEIPLANLGMALTNALNEYDRTAAVSDHTYQRLRKIISANETKYTEDLVPALLGHFGPNEY